MTADSVPAVILAAGVGRRLEPLTNRRPKPMVPVGNRPVLEYVVEAIADAGIDRIVLVVGYHAERIRTHFGDGDDWGIDIEYVEQSTRLGTGHALLQARSAVGERFLVLNGDRIVEPSIIRRVLECVRAGSTPALATTTVAHPREYGVISLAGEHVSGIEEKPVAPVDTNRINAGIYGFSSAIFEALGETTPTGELAITTTLDELAGETDITAVRYDGRWLDVSQLWDLLAVNAALLNGANGVGGVGGDVDSDSDRPADALVDPTAHIGPNAVVGGGTAIGPNAVVGANAVVENTVVFADVVIGPGAVVRDAVLAANVRLGPNVTITGGPSTVVVADAVHRGVDLGGVVGDNATVGGGATLTDGAIVGDDARLEAGAVVDGRVETGAVVRRG